MAAAPEIIALIQQRYDLLRHLENNPCDKRTLVDDTNLSRTTITRALESLEGTDIVQYRDGAWELTFAGQYMFESYNQFYETFEELNRVATLTTELPPDSDLRCKLFHGAQFEVPDLPEPHAPLHELEVLLQSADQVHGLTPVVLPVYSDVLRRTRSERLRLDLKLQEEAWQRLNDTHQPLMEAITSTNLASIDMVHTEFRYSLIIVDEEAVWVGVHNSRGQLTGAAINHEDNAVNCAERLIASH